LTPGIQGGYNEGATGKNTAERPKGGSLMDDNSKLRTITKVTKFFFPVLIVLAIIAIWYIKTGDQQTATPTPQESGLEATNADLKEWRDSGLPVIIVFGTQSCPVCAELKPILKTMNEEYQGRAIIKYIDLTAHPDAADDFPVPAVPALFFFDKGGKPFEPGESPVIEMTLYTDRDTGEHVYTAYMGGMSADQIRFLLSKMGAP